MSASLDNSFEPAVPEQIGEYEIVGTLGEGGMGVVYAGRQPDIGKRVAVKVLRSELSMDRDLVDRFVGEARAVNEIRHRGIVDIFGFGMLPDNRYYLVMEQLEGRSLEQVLDDERKVSVATVLDWTQQVLEALDAAHACGVIHRDLKPSNLFLVEQPRQASYVKLLDFGIAKLIGNGRKQRTQTAMMIGSPDYMAPEQINGKGVSYSTDFYALGCVMFELLTGKKPFEHKNVAHVLGAKLHGAAPSMSAIEPALPLDLVRLVEWMMERDPKNRPQLVEDVIAHVAALRSQFPKRRAATPAPAPMPKRESDVVTHYEDDAATQLRMAPLAPKKADLSTVGRPAVSKKPLARAEAPSPLRQAQLETRVSRPTPPRALRLVTPLPDEDVPAEDDSLLITELQVEGNAALADEDDVPVTPPAVEPPITARLAAPQQPKPQSRTLLITLLFATMFLTSGITAYLTLQPGPLQELLQRLLTVMR